MLVPFTGIKFTDGLCMPRVIRSTGSCLTCRRRGVRCQWGLGACHTCEKDGHDCFQPISAVSPNRAIPARVAASSVRITPESTLTIRLNPGSWINTGPGQRRGPLAPVEPSDIMPRLTQQIIEAQRDRLSRVPGSIPDPAGGEQDHDYAAYYDYAYEEHLDGLPLTSKSNTSPLWSQDNVPPLASRLRIYFEHAEEHLLPVALGELPLPLLPANEYSTTEILFYYTIRREAFQSNNAIDIDLKDDKFRQLAYSNPLVMQLIIAYKADHRQVSDAVYPSGEGAEDFHATAIREFGPKIARYLAGNEDEMLALTLGSVTLSLAEMARLNKYGQAQNYAPYAKSILTSLATLPHDEVANNLPDFLVEYAMHTVSFACVSTNAAQATSVPFMNEMLRTKVNDMIALRYKGNLCGIWLEVLFAIQRTFQLGMSMKGHPSGCITPSDIINFGMIQASLVEFANDHDFDERGSTQEVAAAGLFKRAAMLYLWSLLDGHTIEQKETAGIRATGISNMVALSFHALKNDIHTYDPINRALVWPLLILGCFATTLDQQSIINDRLQTIAKEFSVGNARETRFLLTNVWRAPKDQRNPWRLWEHIRGNKHVRCGCVNCMPRVL